MNALIMKNAPTIFSKFSNLKIEIEKVKKYFDSKKVEETGVVNTKSPPGRTSRPDQHELLEANKNTYLSDLSISECKAAAHHGVSPSW
jgi:phosphopantetheine adenylyltransferase